MAHDRRPSQGAATRYAAAVRVLRWFKDAAELRLLARNAWVSVATAYRYGHEAIDVVAQRLTRGPGMRGVGPCPGSTTRDSANCP